MNTEENRHQKSRERKLCQGMVHSVLFLCCQKINLCQGLRKLAAILISTQIGTNRPGVYTKQHEHCSTKRIDSSLQLTCISFSNNIKRYRSQKDGGEHCINNEGIPGLTFKSAAIAIKTSIYLEQQRLHDSSQKRRKMISVFAYFPLQVIPHKQQLHGGKKYSSGMSKTQR